MPAILATPNTSPFLSWLVRIRGRTAVLEKRIEQPAVAVREVMDLLEMGTIWAVPEGVRCVSLGSSEGAFICNDFEE